MNVHVYYICLSEEFFWIEQLLILIILMEKRGVFTVNTLEGDKAYLKNFCYFESGTGSWK